MWGFGWLKKRREHRKAEKNKMEAKSIAALFRGFQHAVASTRSMLAQQQIDLLDQFFDIIQTKDDQGNIHSYYVPRMVTIPTGDGHVQHIPLFSLVQPNSIDLDELEMHMSVRIEESVMKVATSHLDKSEADRVSMKVSMQPKGQAGANRRADTTDVSIKFKSGPPPEGIARIIEQYNNMILPVPRSDYDQKVLKDVPMTSGITAYAASEEAKSESFINEAGKLDTLKVTKRAADPGTDTPEAHDWPGNDDDEPVVLDDTEEG